MGKAGINGFFIAKLNYCFLFHFYLFYVLLSSHYICANLLTYQRCWHICYCQNTKMGSNNNDILDGLSIVDKYVQIAINKLHLLK